MSDLTSAESGKANSPTQRSSPPTTVISPTVAASTRSSISMPPGKAAVSIGSSPLQSIQTMRTTNIAILPAVLSAIKSGRLSRGYLYGLDTPANIDRLLNLPFEGTSSLGRFTGTYDDLMKMASLLTPAADLSGITKASLPPMQKVSNKLKFVPLYQTADSVDMGSAVVNSQTQRWLWLQTTEPVLIHLPSFSNARFSCDSYTTMEWVNSGTVLQLRPVMHALSGPIVLRPGEQLALVVKFNPHPGDAATLTADLIIEYNGLFAEYPPYKVSCTGKVQSGIDFSPYYLYAGVTQGDINNTGWEVIVLNLYDKTISLEFKGFPPGIQMPTLNIKGNGDLNAIVNLSVSVDLHQSIGSYDGEIAWKTSDQQSGTIGFRVSVLAAIKTGSSHLDTGHVVADANFLFFTDGWSMVNTNFSDTTTKWAEALLGYKDTYAWVLTLDGARTVGWKKQNDLDPGEGDNFTYTGANSWIRDNFQQINSWAYLNSTDNALSALWNDVKEIYNAVTWVLDQVGQIESSGDGGPNDGSADDGGD